LESVYEWALGVELADRGLRCAKQKIIRVSYKGRTREELLRCDLLVADCLLLEIKALKEIEPIHEAQLLSYMRLLDVPLGMILNFHAPTMGKGIRRLILKASAEEEDLHETNIPRTHTEDAEIAE
jgi:GxxExxY protein